MPYGSETYEVKGIGGFEPCEPAPISTIANKAAEARGALIELREMVNSTYVALYCNPLHEPEKIPETRCLNDDMDAVEYLAKGILADFMELKKRMV